MRSRYNEYYLENQLVFKKPSGEVVSNECTVYVGTMYQHKACTWKKCTCKCHRADNVQTALESD